MIDKFTAWGVFCKWPNDEPYLCGRYHFWRWPDIPPNLEGCRKSMFNTRREAREVAKDYNDRLYKGRKDLPHYYVKKIYVTISTKR